MPSNFKINFNMPDWGTWAIIGIVIFLILLATHHAATAFTGLFLVGAIYIFMRLVHSDFSSGALWIVLLVLVALLLILGLGYVPAEWQPKETTQKVIGLLPTLSLLG